MATSERRYETESKGPPLSSQELVSLASPAKALLREIAATITLVLTTNWMAIIYNLGYSDEDLDKSHEKPTTKVFKILTVDATKYKGNTDGWYQHFQQKLTSFGNADLTTGCQKVYNKWKDSQSESGFDNIYPALHSNIGSNSHPYQDGGPASYGTNQNRDIDLDRPELSMEINVVADALERVSHNPATAEITKWLRDGVPRIIRLEREVKSLKTRKDISENESQDRKNQVEDLIAENEQLQQQIDLLQAENVELKKAKQDEQLHEFDFVTRKEAQDIKDEEKVRKLEKQRSAPEGDTAEATKEENIKLKMEVGSLKKQIDEIVKVNHSWDEHYRKMKTQLEKQAIDLRKELDALLAVRNENDQLKTETARHHQEMDITQKEKDALLLQAKERIERLEKEKADKQKEVDVLRQKFEKVQGYARTLTNQRKEAEDEISRLNEALARKMRVSSAEVQKRETSPIQSKIANPPDPVYESIPSGVEALIANSLEVPQKRVESMSEAELREELEILRQQTEVYQSDFQHERQDRQRIMGELDETKKELKKYQRELKGPKPQAVGSKQRQLLQDEQYAQQLQRAEEEAMQRPAYNYRPPPQQMAQPRYQPVPQPYQPRRVQQNYYTAEDIQAMQMPNKGLVPHGGAAVYGQQGYYQRPRNYAANDMVIDGMQRGRLEIDGGDEEIDGGPEQSGENKDNQNDENKSCPRCKRSFNQDAELTIHLDRCLAD
ncbi:uncharacterized protein [Amphiura filiformis]|uniref:uncharacterized protein n=1 Tax=Amphiura filiformis TaxID=82378 RepID=UPI003B21A223